MPRRRRRKAKATAISLLILAGTALVVMFLPFFLMGIASLVLDYRGVPHPRDFDPMLLTAMVIGFGLDLIIAPIGLVWAIAFWLRYTLPFDEARCAKCGYDLSGTLEHSQQCPECGQWHESLTGKLVRPKALLICDDPGTYTETM